jgi:alpha-D-ribose 1-methylphosphonate 5-triphosphate synthase subunit PhnH
MKKAHDFDAVFDCQEVFRKLLEAFSNPGKAVDISNNAKKLKSSHGAYLAVAATLLDNETSFCVIGDAALSEMMQQFTYGRPEELHASSFVFVLPGCDASQIENIISKASAGTMTEPHKSAVVFVREDSPKSGAGISIKGPGVNGEIIVPLSAYAARWLSLRREIAHEYPCGVDLAFMTDDGQIVAVPRLVQMVV